LLALVIEDFITLILNDNVVHDHTSCHHLHMVSWLHVLAWCFGKPLNFLLCRIMDGLHKCITVRMDAIS
jgi:hypothetical protein